MEKKKVILKREKETRNTVRFKSADDDVVDTLYIRKPHFRTSKRIRLIIEDVPEESKRKDESE